MRRSLIGATRPGVRARTRLRRPRLECLEDRQLLTVYTVTDTPNKVVTLTDAINLANAHAGPDIINFNLSPAGVNKVAGALPAITDTVTIDGSSQPGYQNTPLIALDGGGTVANGLQISASDTVIKALAIYNYNSNGIVVGANNVSITGCVIGTDTNGAKNVPNKNAGILVQGASQVAIGGSTSLAHNLISGNGGAGIELGLGSSKNVIVGNYIGTTSDGNGALPNGGPGIRVLGDSNFIGGDQPGDSNVISGNTGAGVLISGAPARNNLVDGNLIGVSQASNAPVPNGGNGVDVQNAAFTTIGGTTTGTSNLIGANALNGIRLSGASSTRIQGNTIGTNQAGSLDLGNGSAGILLTNSSNNAIGGTLNGAGNVIAFNGKTVPSAGVTILSGNSNPILSNSIYSNTALGIDLGGDGITANDTGDTDTGANGLQNYPIFSRRRHRRRPDTPSRLLQQHAEPPVLHRALQSSPARSIR